MFYRKYRPQKFSELFGLESVTRALTAQLKKNQVGHAYLFAGPRGTGKTTTARILAKEVGCRGLDLVEIDAASNRGVDDIRRLREKIGLAPTAGGKKVYIIDEVHMLTREAFNALLKTLEEPPDHVIFVLCTTEPHKVPETIRSRCQRFDFKRASTRDIVKKLRFIADQEKEEISDEDLELIAKNAEGGFRDAETMLEQVIVGGLAAAAVVGLTGGESVSRLVENLLEKDAAAAIKFINKLYTEGADLENFVKSLLEYLRGLMLIKYRVGDELLEAPEEIANRMKSEAGRLSVQKLELMITEFTHAAENIAVSPIPQLPLELAVVRIIDREGSPETSYAIDNDVVVEADSWSNHLSSGNSEADQRSTSPPSSPGTTAQAASAGRISDIVSRWDMVLAKVKPYNHSLEALLRSCRPLKIEDGTLQIEAFYKFHKERLEEVKNRGILEKVLQELTGVPLRVRTFLGRKEHSSSSKRRSSTESSDKDFDDLGDLEEKVAEAFNGKL